MLDSGSDLVVAQLGPDLGVGVGQDAVATPEVGVGHALRKSVLVKTDCVQDLSSSEL